MKIDGEKLKTAREAAGKGRVETAAVAGFTRAYLWQVERVDRIVHMNDNVVKAIAKFIGVKPDDLEAK